MEKQNPFDEARGTPEPVITGDGPSGLNMKWIYWYRVHFGVSNNIAIRIGLRTIRERNTL